MRFITAGIEKFRGPQYRLNMEEMKGANSTAELFRTKMEDFVHGELSEKYEGDNGLDPEKLKEAFGEKFFNNSSYVEHFEKPVIDFSKLPGGDPDGIKEVLDLFIQDDLTIQLEGDSGLDMEKVTSTFGEKFANNADFFVKEGNDTYFSDELKNVLVDTPKDQLAEVLGADAIPAFVKIIGDEYGRHVIQSGTQFGNGLVDLLATTTNPDQLAKVLARMLTPRLSTGSRSRLLTLVLIPLTPLTSTISITTLSNLRNSSKCRKPGTPISRLCQNGHLVLLFIAWVTCFCSLELPLCLESKPASHLPPWPCFTWLFPLELDCLWLRELRLLCRITCCSSPCSSTCF